MRTTFSASQHEVPLSELNLRWLQMRAERSLQKGGASYAWEILKRASAGNEDAWVFYCEGHQLLLQKWVRQEAENLAQEERDAIVNATWERFARTMTPAKLTGFAHYGAIMQYLRCCAHSITMDFHRQQKQRQSYDTLNLSQDLSLVEQTGPYGHAEEEVVNKLFIQEIQAAIQRAMHNENERILADMIFFQQMPVRIVCQLYPEHFPDHETTYKCVRNIRKRLKKNEEICTLLSRTVRKKGAARAV